MNILSAIVSILLFSLIFNVAERFVFYTAIIAGKGAVVDYYNKTLQNIGPTIANIITRLNTSSGPFDLLKVFG